MAQPDTAVRLLDSAEQLFAERGFAETSLRVITGRAGVNLAAVNYHFGSKDALIQAVFERFLSPFCAELDAALDARLVAGPAIVAPAELLALVAKIVTGMHARDPQRSVVFMRLIGLAYNESQGHLRGWLRTRYGGSFARLERLLEAALPAVPREELFWRMHFALGSVVFTLSGLAPLSALAAGTFGRRPDVAAITARLLPFLEHGLLQESRLKEARS